LSAPRRTFASAAASGFAAYSAGVSAPGFSARGSSARWSRTDPVVLVPNPRSAASVSRRCSARAWSRKFATPVRDAESAATPGPRRPAARACTLRTPYAPAAACARAVSPRAGAVRSERKSSTPPDALP
jgi:hypothetical protein